VSGAIVHAVAVEAGVSADRAFEYLADGLRQSDWALGSWNREQIEADLFRGTSLFTGEATYVRIIATPAVLLVDYDVGPTPETMMRVNSARAVPGPALGRVQGTSVVTLMKWRLRSQDDDQWHLARATFETEIHMIKGRLERGF